MNWLAGSDSPINLLLRASCAPVQSCWVLRQLNQPSYLYWTKAMTRCVQGTILYYCHVQETEAGGKKIMFKIAILNMLPLKRKKSYFQTMAICLEFHRNNSWWLGPIHCICALFPFGKFNMFAWLYLVASSGKCCRHCQWLRNPNDSFCIARG